MVPYYICLSFSLPGPDRPSASALCFLLGGFPKEMRWSSQATTKQRSAAPVAPKCVLKTLVFFSVHVVFHHLTPRQPWKGFSKCILSSQIWSKAYGKQCRYSCWYSVWALCHLLQLRSHPCSMLSEECCSLSREYWSHLALTLKNIKYKWNGVTRLPKIYYMAGCKSRWQAQEIGLLCSRFSLLQSSLASSRKPILTFNNWKWSVFKISEPILSLIYYLTRNRFSDVLTDIILPIKCRGCGYLTSFLTTGQEVIILNFRNHPLMSGETSTPKSLGCFWKNSHTIFLLERKKPQASFVRIHLIK